MQLVRLGLLLAALQVCWAVAEVEDPGETAWQQYIDCEALTANRHDARKEGRWCFDIPLQVLNTQQSQTMCSSCAFRTHLRSLLSRLSRRLFSRAGLPSLLRLRRSALLALRDHA